jgi:hypothetical protein
MAVWMLGRTQWSRHVVRNVHRNPRLRIVRLHLPVHMQHYPGRLLSHRWPGFYFIRWSARGHQGNTYAEIEYTPFSWSKNRIPDRCGYSPLRFLLNGIRWWKEIKFTPQCEERSQFFLQGVRLENQGFRSSHLWSCRHVKGFGGVWMSRHFLR